MNVLKCLAKGLTLGSKDKEKKQVKKKSLLWFVKIYLVPDTSSFNLYNRKQLMITCCIKSDVLCLSLFWNKGKLQACHKHSRGSRRYLKVFYKDTVFTIISCSLKKHSNYYWQWSPFIEQCIDHRVRYFRWWVLSWWVTKKKRLLFSPLV